MDETLTTAIMGGIFITVGIGLPVLLMLRDKTQQSTLPNKLILWITMVFCMALVFGVAVDFKNLSENIRSDTIQYGFVSLMLFGSVFGIDQLLKSRHISTVKWKDLTISTSGGECGECGKHGTDGQNPPETDEGGNETKNT